MNISFLLGIGAYVLLLIICSVFASKLSYLYLSKSSGSTLETAFTILIFSSIIWAWALIFPVGFLTIGGLGVVWLSTMVGCYRAI